MIKYNKQNQLKKMTVNLIIDLDAVNKNEVDFGVVSDAFTF